MIRRTLAFFARFALVSLALVGAFASFLFGSLELFGNAIRVANTLDAAQFRAMYDTVLYFPFTVIAVLSHLVSGDCAYIMSTIETGYGSIRWRYTGSVKHFPQYDAIRLEPCPAFLLRLRAAAISA
jgi:hypothetical protein